MSHQALDRVEHVGIDGCWTLERRLPSPVLRRFVHGYAGYVERGGRPVWRREIASPIVPLILNFDAPWDIAEIGRTNATPFARSFIAGLHDRPVVVGSRGRALSLQIDLTPLGASRLLGMPIAAIVGRTIALQDCIGASAGRLENMVLEAKDWATRFDVLDRLLTARLAGPTVIPTLAEAAWRAIDASSGRVAIGHLAGRLDVSRKHLDETVRNALGLPPKRLARLVRFSRAAAVLSSAGPASLAEIALACGYYDQAHLNRDFRAFAAEAPTAYRARCLPDGTGALDR